MNTEQLLREKEIQKLLLVFFKQYTISDFKQALLSYMNMRAELVYTYRNSVFRVKINDIYYLEIHGHSIDIQTSSKTYHKYGTLNSEQEFLSLYGFVKCRQNCLVSLQKIQAIIQDTIILDNNVELHMSRRYAPQVLAAFKSEYVSKSI